MMKFFLPGIAVIATLTTGVVYATPPTGAGSARTVTVSGHAPAERGKVAGTVDSVDAGANHIHIKTLSGTKDFGLSPNTKIVRYGRPAAVADLTNGARVRSLRYDKKTNTALRIELGSK